MLPIVGVKPTKPAVIHTPWQYGHAFPKTHELQVYTMG